MFSVGHIGFTVLHCTELSGFVLQGSALSCEVSSFPASRHVPGGFESEELPAVCLCVSVCGAQEWSPLPQHPVT